MSDKTYEVPIMLSPDNLTYEDIAKLNPFYEEYRAFWSKSPVTGDTSFSSDGLSSDSSLQSNHSAIPFEVASSPSFRVDHHHPPSPVHESAQAAWRNCSQRKPTYDEYHGLDSSQVAVLEVEELSKKPLTTVGEPVNPSEPENLVLDPAEDAALERTQSSHKKLFGENGWLGCIAELESPPSRKPKYTYTSLKGLGKRIKQQVEEIAGDLAKAYPNPFNGSYQPRVAPGSAIPISLDPTAQAKLYSEMEVMICVSANKFLIQQFYEGRISKDSIKRVTNFWGSKNRPQVVEFQFDQATQRQLILSNIRTLNFNGESSTNPVLLNSNLQNWKAIVKEMSVRTFCAPDSVIRKHLHDIQKLLDMLGAPVATFLAFEELQLRTLVSMKENRAKSHRAECGRSMSSASIRKSQ